MPGGGAACRGGSAFLPFEGIDQVIQVLLQKVVDDGQGIFIGCRVKIESSPQKMAGSVRKEELLGGGCVATDMEKDASNSIWGMDHGLIDGTGLVGMLVGHLERIVGQLVKGVACLLRVVRWGTDVFIADIDFGIEAGEFDIDPVGILGNGVEVAAVADDVGIDGVFKAIGIAGTVESLVFVLREIDPEIPATFWRVGAVTGLEAGGGQQKNIREG